MARVDPRGQSITFAIQADEDQNLTRWIWIPVKKGDTIAKLAAARGHSDMARQIADENDVRSVNSPFTGRGKKRIKVPPQLAEAESFSVLAGDAAPKITAGYAKFSTVDRPERVGLMAFEGYDPITMTIPVRFQAPPGSRAGYEVDQDIVLLERMAGRGHFEGASVGPPPVIKISTVGPLGETVPLIPRNYQRTTQNPTAPLWRITEIDWDDEPIRNSAGNRVRQLAVITVQQATRVSLLSRSAAERSKAKPKHAKPKKKVKKK